MTTNAQTAVFKPGDKAVTHQPRNLKEMLDSQGVANRIKQLLGERAPQFCSTLVRITQSGPLAECEPSSVLAAGITAATLDLPIDPNLGFAHIVPYGKMATFVIGYKGFTQLAMRSGQFKLLNVTEVYEGELQSYNRVESRVVIDHTKASSTKVVGFVAYMQLINGFEHAEYWSEERVWQHAEKFSQAVKGQRKQSPWFTNFEAMACKTVLKHLLSHWAPLSVVMQKAIVEDQGGHVDVDAEVTYPDNEPPTEAPAPQIEGPKATPRKPRQSVREQAGLTTEPPAGDAAQGEAQQQTGDLPDLDNCRETLGEYLTRDGVTEDKVLFWCKSQNFCKKDVQDLWQVKDDALRRIIVNWKTLLPVIKSLVVPAQ